MLKRKKFHNGLLKSMCPLFNFEIVIGQFFLQFRTWLCFFIFELGYVFSLLNLVMFFHFLTWSCFFHFLTWSCWSNISICNSTLNGFWRQILLFPIKRSENFRHLDWLLSLNQSCDLLVLLCGKKWESRPGFRRDKLSPSVDGYEEGGWFEGWQEALLGRKKWKRYRWAGCWARRGWRSGSCGIVATAAVVHGLSRRCRETLAGKNNTNFFPVL